MILDNTQKLALVGLITVSIGAKVFLDMPIYYEQLSGELIDSVHGALADAGYQTVLDASVPSILTRNENCVVSVSIARAQGGDDYTYQNSMYGSENAYWYRGDLYSDVPRYRVLFDRALQRLSMAAGARPAILPLFRLSYLADCTSEDLVSLYPCQSQF